MSFRRMENKATALVGAASALEASLPTVGSVVSPANLPAGAIVVTDLGLVRLSAVPAKSDFLVVQGNGTSEPLLKSEILNESRISISKAEFRPATQQITAIGFNGTTGALPAANDTSYFIKIRKNDNDAGNRSQPFSLFAQFKTDATGSQEELAFGLTKVGIKNMEDEPANGYLRFETLSDTAADTAVNVDVVYGSKEAELAAAGTAAVGDIITIDGVAYKIDAIVGTTVTLNMPYQGVTATGVSADYNPIAGTNFGVRLRGVEAPFNVSALIDFYSNRFTATFSDPTVPTTHIQGATEGTGAWQRVAMDEYMTYGFEGMNEMISIPPNPRDQYVVEGAKYSAIQIRWKEGVDTLVTTHVGEGSVILYTELDGASELPATLAAGAAANVIGALATPTFVSTDLNE